MWDVTVGGSAVSGESSQDAIERELFEEIGLRHDFQKIRPQLTINFDKGFNDIYLIEREVDLDSLCLQPEEVQRVKWASQEEIFRMMESGEFIPYYEPLLQLLFEMRKGYGTIR